MGTAPGLRKSSSPPKQERVRQGPGLLLCRAPAAGAVLPTQRGPVCTYVRPHSTGPQDLESQAAGMGQSRGRCRPLQPALLLSVTWSQSLELHPHLPGPELHRRPLRRAWEGTRTTSSPWMHAGLGAGRTGHAGMRARAHNRLSQGQAPEGQDGWPGRQPVSADPPPAPTPTFRAVSPRSSETSGKCP